MSWDDIHFGFLIHTNNVNYIKDHPMIIPVSSFWDQMLQQCPVLHYLNVYRVLYNT
jgi:hypothetical protein